MKMADKRVIDIFGVNKWIDIVLCQLGAVIYVLKSLFAVYTFIPELPGQRKRNK